MFHFKTVRINWYFVVLKDLARVANISASGNLILLTRVKIGPRMEKAVNDP